MARRVAAAIILVCLATTVTIFASGSLAAGSGVVSSTSSPEGTGPPNPAAATQAFGRWLHAHYGSVRGYWTCPLSQRYDNRIDCLAEVQVAETRHLTAVAA